MANSRKLPRLREKTVRGLVYQTAEVWKPDGKRTTVSFGPAGGNRALGDIYAAFGKWVKLYEANPHKTLSFASPYEAIQLMDEPGGIVAIGDLADHYLRFAESTFKLTSKGKLNPHFHRLTVGLKALAPYRDWPVNNFGPDELRAVQKALVAYRYGRGDDPDKARALTRDSLNEIMQQLRRMFSWAVGRGIMRGEREQAFQEVRPLRLGAPGTSESRTRRSITDKEFERTAAAANPEVADMMRVMWLTPCRPSEVCEMRPADILRSDKACWLYVPGRDRVATGDSKTAHQGRPRAIPITKRLQKILAPRISSCTSPTQRLFSPARALAWLRETRLAARATPIQQGNRPGTNRREHPMITPGEAYTDQSFCVAVKRACVRAGVEPFTPYDLRRSTITRTRAIVGKEAAATLSGHADTKTTDLYLLNEVREAVKVAKALDGKLG